MQTRGKKDRAHATLHDTGDEWKEDPFLNSEPSFSDSFLLPLPFTPSFSLPHSHSHSTFLSQALFQVPLSSFVSLILCFFIFPLSHMICLFSIPLPFSFSFKPSLVLFRGSSSFGFSVSLSFFSSLSLTLSDSQFRLPFMLCFPNLLHPLSDSLLSSLSHIVTSPQCTNKAYSNQNRDNQHKNRVQSVYGISQLLLSPISCAPAKTSNRELEPNAHTTPYRAHQPERIAWTRPTPSRMLCFSTLSLSLNPPSSYPSCLFSLFAVCSPLISFSFLSFLLFHSELPQILYCN